MIVTETFTKNLTANPSGKRKESPTIFDELRWAMQHSEDPLRQTMQLISEIHGPWTGMTEDVLGLLNLILSLYNSKSSKININAKAAVGALGKLVAPSSNIGRLSSITANDMNPAFLREFVRRSQNINPAVFTFIQHNIGKYPYFQQVSEQVGSLGQAILTKRDVKLEDRVKTNGKNSWQTSYPVRRNSDIKIFSQISSNIDISDAFLDVCFLRCLSSSNNGAILEKSDTSISHGFDLSPDILNKDRVKKSSAPCLAEAVNRFGPTIKLLDTFFPVKYEVKPVPEFKTIKTEIGSVMVDQLARPVKNDPALPVAKQEYKKNNS